MDSIETVVQDAIVCEPNASGVGDRDPFVVVEPNVARRDGQVVRILNHDAVPIARRRQTEDLPVRDSLQPNARIRRRPVADCDVPDDEVRVRIPNLNPRAGRCEDRPPCDDEGVRGRAGPTDHAARGREIPVAVDENRALIQAHRNGTGGTRSDRQDRHREEKRGYGERPSSWPKAEHGPSQETIFARLYRPSLRGTAAFRRPKKEGKRHGPPQDPTGSAAAWQRP